MPVPMPALVHRALQAIDVDDGSDHRGLAVIARGEHQLEGLADRPHVDECPLAAAAVRLHANDRTESAAGISCEQVADQAAVDVVPIPFERCQLEVVYAFRVNDPDDEPRQAEEWDRNAVESVMRSHLAHDGVEVGAKGNGGESEERDRENSFSHGASPSPCPSPSTCVGCRTGP